MFRELISIFKGDNPLGRMGDNFTKMLGLTQAQTVRAGKIFFSQSPSPEERTAIYKQDVKVNKLERKIRKQVIAHLSVSGNSADVPYSLATLAGLLARAGIEADPADFRRYGSARKLYNFDVDHADFY